MGSITLIRTMTPTNTSLIRRVRDPHDADAWAEFVALYEPLLVAYVRNRGLSETDAGDIVQEIFISLLRSLPSFTLDHSRGRFRTWLWQVTMNAIADHQRRRQSIGKAEDRWREQAPAYATDEPDEEWNAAHRQRLLAHVLQKTKATAQERTWYCFEQHVLKGRSGVELAQELGITANAVCVNANRVLERVRALCAEYMEELDGDESDLPPKR